MTPEGGAVLGIDVGYSEKRFSSAICRLEWDARACRWEIARFRHRVEERDATIRRIAGGREILVAAFDGPFRGDLAQIGEYRCAERVLTRRVAALIGKPGASNSKSGRLLNDATNAAVGAVLDCVALPPATHLAAVHDRAVVESFPNAFMGVMLPDGHGLNSGRANKSDRYFRSLVESGRLPALLARLLPGRATAMRFEHVRDHDDRAALICAIAALCVVVRSYVAVGDSQGRIVLPPSSEWNQDIFALIVGNCDGEAGALIRES